MIKLPYCRPFALHYLCRAATLGRLVLGFSRSRVAVFLPARGFSELAEGDLSLTQATPSVSILINVCRSTIFENGVSPSVPLIRRLR